MINIILNNKWLVISLQAIFMNKVLKLLNSTTILC